MTEEAYRGADPDPGLREALDQVVTDEMDEAVAKWGSPRRTVLLDADPDGTLTPVVAQVPGLRACPSPRSKR